MRDTSIKLTNGRILEIKVSIGGAAYPDYVDDVDDLVREADEAELEAKQAGGDRIIVRSNGKDQTDINQP
jgi:GGDEF domain-containing protein